MNRDEFELDYILSRAMILSGLGFVMAFVLNQLPSGSHNRIFEKMGEGFKFLVKEYKTGLSEEEIESYTKHYIKILKNTGYSQIWENITDAKA